MLSSDPLGLKYTLFQCLFPKSQYYTEKITNKLAMCIFMCVISLINANFFLPLNI